MRSRVLFYFVATVFAFLPAKAFSQENEALAKQLANPVASLISVPFQGNYDCCYGPSRGDRYTLNIQPVIPIKLNEDWNLITRTIVPVISAEAKAPGLQNLSGLGDVTQSFFISPQRPTSNGIIWGVGPVFLYPTGTDELSQRRWGAGPTAVALKQDGPWTIGVLTNHIWSFADSGMPTGPSISSTFVQPFIAYTTRSAFSITLNTESTYDWVAHQWTVPINLFFAQVFKIGTQPASLQVGPRYYAETPLSGPRWGVRVNFTLLFPTK